MASPASNPNPPSSSPDTAPLTAPVRNIFYKPLGTTTTVIISSTELASHPYLPGLYSLINTAFATSHAKRPELIPPSKLRFSSPQHLIDELGPDGFTYIIYSYAPVLNGKSFQDSNIPVATVSCKPWAPAATSNTTASSNAVAEASRSAAPTLEPTTPSGPAARESTLFRSSQRPPPPSTSTTHPQPSPTTHTNPLPAWELLAMVVASTHQSRGLGSKLLDLVVGAIKERSGTADGDIADAGGGGAEHAGKIRLTLSTVKELAEKYYLKKGFRTVRTMWVEKGVYGSVSGFEIVDMERIV